MNTKYCANCGSPNYYSLNLPNLCSNCGSKFHTQSFKPQVFANKTVKQLPNEAFDEIDEPIDTDFDDVDFVTLDNRHTSRGGIKMGDLAFDNSAKQVHRNIPKVSKKDAQAKLDLLLKAAKSDSALGVMNEIPFNEKD